MTEHIREAGIRHVSEVACSQKQLVEKAFYMRAQSYLAHIKAQLLTNTIFEVEDQRKELRQINQELEHKQRALTAEIAHRQAIFDNSSAGIVVVDKALRILEANPHFLRMLGYEAEDLVDRAASTVHVSPQGFEDFLARMKYASTQDGSHHTEYALQRKDGSEIWCDISGRPINPANPGSAVVCVCVDITDRKRAEAELIRAREIAESGNRAKSAFLANMSHELRTPLNAMLGYAQILQRDPKIDERQRAAINTIKRSGDYLLSLINDVLDLAKIESGRFELQPAPCDLKTLLHGARELFRIRAEAKGLGFRFQEQTRLPSVVEVDEKRLHQVLMNLLGNAIKFTEQGEVWLYVGWQAEWLCLEIGDTGVGIDRNELPRLFEPFHQGGAAHYRTQGTGLGLAITRNLVKQMKGRIEVLSEEGQGSRFLVEIPLRMVAGPTDERGAESLAAPSPYMCGYRRTDGREGLLRILVVDDIMDNRVMLRDMLEPLGFQLSEAKDAAEALDRVREGVDLVLMDLVLPDIDGIEATRRILALTADAPTKVVAVSASVYPSDYAQCLAAGCKDHLPKPVDEDRLLQMLARHLPLRWIAADVNPPPPAVQTDKGRVDEAAILLEQHREQLALLAQRGKLLELRELLDTLCASLSQPGPLGEMREAACDFNLRLVREILACV